MRFTDNGDGTVTDHKTGLMWSKNANQGQMSWEKAMEHCQALKRAGHNDWRLPDRFELESLLDISQFLPALPEDHPFENVQSAYYWSSSTPAHNTFYAWIVYMNYGNVHHYSKTRSYYVWPVRGGDTERR